MDSRNPSKMPKTSSNKKKEKVTTSLEILRMRMTNDYEASVSLPQSNKKADDP